jgi:hypothetical protein
MVDARKKHTQTHIHTHNKDLTHKNLFLTRLRREDVEREREKVQIETHTLVENAIPFTPYASSGDRSNKNHRTRIGLRENAQARVSRAFYQPLSQLFCPESRTYVTDSLFATRRVS